MNTFNRRGFIGISAAVTSLPAASLSVAADSCHRTTDDPGPQLVSPPEPVAAKEALAMLPDVRLLYWDTGGRGVPVILLHPFTGSAHVWPYQQPVLARAGFRVIGYSRRGFAGSDTGSADQPGTGSGDLHALITALGIQRFHIVASAGGGFVAADYAISHPERLLSITLACSILGVQDAEFTALNSALSVPGFQELPAYFRELGPSYRALNPSGTQHWRELEASSRAPGPMVMQPNANQLTLSALEQLKIPSMLLCGDADLIAPPPLMRKLAQHIRGSRLQILPESGHSAYWERPDLFNAAVLKFLRRSG